MNKKRIAVLVVVLVTLAAAAVLAVLRLDLPDGLGGTAAIRTGWTARNMSGRAGADSWNYTAARINGNTRRDIEFDAESLARLHIESQNSGGSIRLTLTQGDIEEVIDLSGTFAGNIDARRFSPGRIRLSLRFDSALDVDLRINWGR